MTATKSATTMLGTLALLLLGSATGTHAAQGENFAFAVQAEAGLELVITGYDSRGRMMFQENTRSRETYNGRKHYIVRVDEDLVDGARLKQWCVEDLTGNWHVLPVDGPRVACDTRPVDNRGTYAFVSRSFPTGGSGRGDEAVLCVQKELNQLGFDAGKEDGVLGPQTRQAGEAYIRYMKSGPGGDGWAQPSLTRGNARHWCDKVAEAHPAVSRFWKAIR